MDAPNPYQSPRADLQLPEPPAEGSFFIKFLPSFLSGAATVLMLVYFLGAMQGVKNLRFLLDPGFIATLVACGGVSAVILWPLHRAHWIIRSLLAIPTSILFFIALMLVLRMFLR